MRERFSAPERRTVRAAQRRAADLVTRFYALAPREWTSMDYEVRTLDELEPTEVVDSALAHVVCYGVRREVDNRVVAERDLYRICLQDHRILDRHRGDGLPLQALLLYVLTHELVHVVRFGQRMQTLDLPACDRKTEEESVDRTARLILRHANPHGIDRVFRRFADTVD